MKEGQIAAEGSVDDLITQVAGCVWKCTVLPNEAARLENSYNICNVKAVGQKIELRILSEELPHPQAHAVTPVLEDVFMRYFGKAGEYDAV